MTFLKRDLFFLFLLFWRLLKFESSLGLGLGILQPDPSFSLTNFRLMLPFYTPWKYWKSFGKVLVSRYFQGVLIGNSDLKSVKFSTLVWNLWVLSNEHSINTRKKRLMSAWHLLIWSFCQIKKVHKNQYFEIFWIKAIKNNSQKPYPNSTVTIFVHSYLTNYQKKKFCFVHWYWPSVKCGVTWISETQIVSILLSKAKAT